MHFHLIAALPHYRSDGASEEGVVQTCLYIHESFIRMELLAKV